MTRAGLLNAVHRLGARLLPDSFRQRHGQIYLLRRTSRAWLQQLTERRRGDEPLGPELVDVTSVESTLPPGATHDVAPPEHVVLEPPRHAGTRFAKIPWWYGSPLWSTEFELAAARVLEIPQGIVYGVEGWVGPQDDQVISDWNAYERTDLQTTRACADARDRGVRELPGATASLLHLGFGNYYHWLIQGLPRLCTILEAIDPARIDRFLVGELEPFIDESLRRVGIESARVESIPDFAPALRCETLLTARLPRHEAPPPRWAIDRVRACFGAPSSEARGERLYLERGDTPRRRVVNEADVLALLERRGFRSLSFDGMTVAEQADTIAGADVIVAAQGAALTNLVFARPGTRVIEFLPANYPQPFFFHLARQVGADYEAIVGTEPAIRKRHNIWMNDADIVVDLQELTEALSD